MIRPEVGDKTTTIQKVPICAMCGNQINDTNLCDPNCDFDTDPIKEGRAFYAVYERTDVFLRDEEIATEVRE